MLGGVDSIGGFIGRSGLLIDNYPTGLDGVKRCRLWLGCFAPKEGANICICDRYCLDITGVVMFTPDT